MVDAVDRYYLRVRFRMIRFEMLDVNVRIVEVISL